MHLGQIWLAYTVLLSGGNCHCRLRSDWEVLLFLIYCTCPQGCSYAKFSGYCFRCTHHSDQTCWKCCDAGRKLCSSWVSAKAIDKGAALYAKILLYDYSLPPKIAALNWSLTCLVMWQIVLSEQSYHCVIGAKWNKQGHRYQNLYQLAKISVLQDRELIFLCNVKAQSLPVPSIVMCSPKKLRKKIETHTLPADKEITCSSWPVTCATCMTWSHYWP